MLLDYKIEARSSMAKETKLRNLTISGGNKTFIITEDGKIHIFANGVSTGLLAELCEMASSFDLNYKKFKDNPNMLKPSKMSVATISHLSQ